jgi:hypothetical protein
MVNKNENEVAQHLSEIGIDVEGFITDPVNSVITMNVCFGAFRSLQNRGLLEDFVAGLDDDECVAFLIATEIHARPDIYETP